MVLVIEPGGNRQIEEPGHKGVTVLKWIFEKYERCAYWMYVLHDRDHWRVLVNVVMNVCVLCNTVKFLTK